MDFTQLFSKYSQNKNCTLSVSVFESPLGNIISAADDEYLCFVAFQDSKNIDKIFGAVSRELSCCYIENETKISKLLHHELKAYFEGNLIKFTVPLRTGGSDFQKEVWDKLMEVPYGSTQSYGDLAKSIGRPSNHARAVGAACGANAHIIVIPCHRLVGSNNKGGFGPGINRKDWLMEHEKKNSNIENEK